MSVRHDIFYLRTQLDGVIVVVSARRHLEYFALTFTVEYPVPLEVETHRAREHINIERHFNELHQIALRRFSRNDPKQNEDPNTRPRMTDDDALTEYNSDERIVVPLKAWVTKIIDLAFEQAPLCHIYSISMFGGVFADFFGSIFAIRPNEEGSKLDVTGPIAIDDPKRELRLERQVLGRRISPDSATKVADAMLSIARGFSAYRPGEDMYGSPEYSVSMFQNDTVMYISSLGRLVPSIRSIDTHHEDVRYTLVVTYGSKWRLGRFVDRLHTLGMLRLAALSDLYSITSASNKINRAFSMLGGIDLK